ncbi:hypothetical protein HDU97_001996 [Phlyctochytrium planicorne]|nr:hypothetical protein HDU97_001996 [Phlyctochytrium planicorne]
MSSHLDIDTPQLHRLNTIDPMDRPSPHPITSLRSVYSTASPAVRTTASPLVETPQEWSFPTLPSSIQSTSTTHHPNTTISIPSIHVNQPQSQPQPHLHQDPEADDEDLLLPPPAHLKGALKRKWRLKRPGNPHTELTEECKEKERRRVLRCLIITFLIVVLFVSLFAIGLAVKSRYEPSQQQEHGREHVSSHLLSDAGPVLEGERRGKKGNQVRSSENFCLDGGSGRTFVGATVVVAKDCVDKGQVGEESQMFYVCKDPKDTTDAVALAYKGPLTKNIETCLDVMDSMQKPFLILSTCPPKSLQYENKQLKFENENGCFELSPTGSFR